MRATNVDLTGALATTACLWLWTGTARAAEWASRPAGLTPDDNLGLLAMLSGMLAVWFYFRLATEDPQR